MTPIKSNDRKPILYWLALAAMFVGLTAATLS
jgi:hypothetical protein